MHPEPESLSTLSTINYEERPMSNQETSKSTHPKSNFIEDEKYALLKEYQQKVFDTTEVSPTIRKLVNALITEESLNKVTNKLIESLT